MAAFLQASSSGILEAVRSMVVVARAPSASVSADDRPAAGTQAIVKQSLLAPLEHISGDAVALRVAYRRQDGTRRAFDHARLRVLVAAATEGEPRHRGGAPGLPADQLSLLGRGRAEHFLVVGLLEVGMVGRGREGRAGG